MTNAAKKNRPWLRIFGIALAFVLVAGSASAGHLLVAGGEEETKALSLFETSPAYRALAESPATAAIRWVRANPGEVSLDTHSLSLALGEGLDLTLRRVDSYLTESGSLVWAGVVVRAGARGEDFDPLDTLTLVKNGELLTGNLQYQGQWWQVRPVTGGQHVLVLVDRSRLPPDHPADYDRRPRVEMPVGPGTSDKVNTVITAMVHYTPGAASASGDINGLIDLAFAEANQSYANSGVSITLQLVKKARVTYTENSSFDTDVARYRGTGDGYMDYVHTQRNQYGADVGVLLTTNPQYCGLASGIGSTAATAFAGVLWYCATGNYSFAHEIGHLQSARHDPANDSTNTPYPYGHGYQYNGSPPWRTIMAYPPPGGSPRLNYFSNPNNLYNGLPMGTAATHDNTRVLNNTRATIAGFKTAPSCVPDGGFDDTLYQTSCCSGYAVGGSTYCTDPADWYDDWTSCKHICGTAPAGGCIISGGVDDTLSRTNCCSGAAVPGSTFCNDPADYGDDWTTCAQICQ